jgi:hypothetical protein
MTRIECGSLPTRRAPLSPVVLAMTTDTQHDEVVQVELGTAVLKTDAVMNF